MRKVHRDITSEQIAWCITQHEDTNHFYDEYLPYEFHLRMVERVHQDFANLLGKNIFVDSFAGRITDTTQLVITLACWGHDLIEDTRSSYNDVKSNLGEQAAEIIYACTNEKGKNRAERGNDKYYEGIRNTTGAVFVKLCDRIANVQYSKMTKSRMFEMYKNENDDFLLKMGFNGLDSHDLWDMFAYLNSLFYGT